MKCPRCKVLLPSLESDTCTCGWDLASDLELAARVQRPAALWHGDTPVIDLAALRKVPKESRQELMHAINRALGSAKKDGTE